MAKLSAHGSELLRLEYPTSTKCLMSDGWLLVNRGGTGWKRIRKYGDIHSVVEQARKQYNAKTAMLALVAALPRGLKARAAMYLEISTQHSDQALTVLYDNYKNEVLDAQVRRSEAKG